MYTLYEMLYIFLWGNIYTFGYLSSTPISPSFSDHQLHLSRLTEQQLNPEYLCPSWRVFGDYLLTRCFRNLCNAMHICPLQVGWNIVSEKREWSASVWLSTLARADCQQCGTECDLIWQIVWNATHAQSQCAEVDTVVDATFIISIPRHPSTHWISIGYLSKELIAFRTFRNCFFLCSIYFKTNKANI